MLSDRADSGLATIARAAACPEFQLPMTAERDLEPIVRGLYDHPEHRHAVDVTSEDDVGALRADLEATLTRLYGDDAMWGRGVRVRVERDDAGTPCRVWLWRGLVGGQRTDREGFSGQQRTFRA